MAEFMSDEIVDVGYVPDKVQERNRMLDKMSVQWSGIYVRDNSRIYVG